MMREPKYGSWEESSFVVFEAEGCEGWEVETSGSTGFVGWCNGAEKIHEEIWDDEMVQEFVEVLVGNVVHKDGGEERRLLFDRNIKKGRIATSIVEQ